ncbi:MAG: DUF6148 family protein [Dehalococcoidia bacterium]|jgi:hypothetical protein
MAQITTAQAEAQLALWLEADAKVATGQSYSIAGRALTRADAAEITNKIVFWNDMVGRLSGTGGMKIRGVTPCI